MKLTLVSGEKVMKEKFRIEDLQNNAKDSIDYETDFFMELLECYRDELLKYGFSKEKVLEKVSCFKIISLDTFFSLIGEYEKVLKKRGKDEFHIDEKLGPYIQAFGGFSTGYYRGISETLPFIEFKKSIATK